MPAGWFALAAAVILAASLALTAAGRQDANTAGGQGEEEEFARVGYETTERFCVECHSYEDMTATRRTAREWSDTVVSMAARGANATAEQLGVITRYLTRYHGVVRVNTAPAEELSAVLGLSPKDATAIVDYRRAHGKFPNVEALLKVPGIDTSKIEAQPDALRFD